ncbi:hypothetical protein KI387_026887, partial [Taxus chinensis]
ASSDGSGGFQVFLETGVSYLSLAQFDLGASSNPSLGGGALGLFGGLGSPFLDPNLALDSLALCSSIQAAGGGMDSACGFDGGLGEDKFVGGGGATSTGPYRGGLGGAKSFLSMAKSGCRHPIKPMAYVKQTPKVSFGEDVSETIDYFQMRGLICRFSNG